MVAKYHWRLLQGGETAGDTRAKAVRSRQTGLPDLGPQIEFCHHAEQCGLTGLLTDIGAAKPDPLLLAAALGLATQRIEFIVACRSGLIPPTTYVQQVNTLSALINGRVSLNVVAGHSPGEQRSYGDFCPHDERYARTAEFLHIAQALWRGAEEVSFQGKFYQLERALLNTPFVSSRRWFPEIFIAGGSENARDLAIAHGTCWMRFPDAPQTLRTEIEPVLQSGKEVGLRMSLIARPTRREALRAARELVERPQLAQCEKQQEASFVRNSDSVSIARAYALAEKEWLTPTLWTGAVHSHGAPALALVGTPAEIAEALLEYQQAGVSQFIFSGWPKLDEMLFFGREILPSVRRFESSYLPPMPRPQDTAGDQHELS